MAKPGFWRVLVGVGAAFTASFEPYGDPPAAGPAPAPAPAPAAVLAPAPAPAQPAPAVGGRETVLAKILFGLVKRCAELEPGGDEFRQKLLITALTSKKCFGKEVHPQQAVALLRICIADDADRGVAVDHDVLATLSDCLQSERLAAAAAAAPTAERASALVELPLRLLHECVVYMRTQLAADDDRRTRALAAWEGTVASSMFAQILLGLPAAGAAPLPAQLRDAGIDVAIEVAAVDATIAKQILFVLNAAHRGADGSSEEERMAIENNPAARAPSYHAKVAELIETAVLTHQDADTSGKLVAAAIVATLTIALDTVDDRAAHAAFAALVARIAAAQPAALAAEARLCALLAERSPVETIKGVLSQAAPQ